MSEQECVLFLAQFIITVNIQTLQWLKQQGIESVRFIVDNEYKHDSVTYNANTNMTSKANTDKRLEACNVDT